MTGRGLNLDTNLNSASLPGNTKFQNFNQLQNPWINYVEFEFILGPMEKQRPEVSGLKPLSLW